MVDFSSLVERKSEILPCCHPNAACCTDRLETLHEIKWKTIKRHVTPGGGRFTLQDLHQHFLWLRSRPFSTPLSHLNKPNFESKTLSELQSLTQLRVRTRRMINLLRGGRKAHKSSLKVSAHFAHMKKKIHSSLHVVFELCDEDSTQPRTI